MSTHIRPHSKLGQYLLYVIVLRRVAEQQEDSPHDVSSSSTGVVFAIDGRLIDEGVDPIQGH